MTRLGVPGQNINPLSYADERLSVVPVIEAPRRPTVTDKKYPLWTEWRTNKDSDPPAAEGEFWKLVKFNSNGDANWVRFFPGGISSGISDLLDQVGTNVTPDPITFEIEIAANTVANASNPSLIPIETVADAGTHTLDINLQVGTAVTPTPADANSAGIVCVNTNQFTLDATSAMISLKGSTVNPPIMSITLDDTTKTTADATGDINLHGTIVASGTNAKPLFSKRTPASDDIDLQLQVAKEITGAPANKNDAGIASFDDTVFQVDANGYVQLIGGVPPVLNFETDDGPPNVSPTVLGVVEVLGGTGIITSGQGPGNTITVSIDPAAIATTYVGDAGSATPAASILNILGTTGISTSAAGNTVTITGAALASQYTTDAGVVTPAAGNVNVLGGTGIATSGAGSTITITNTNSAITFAGDSGNATPAAGILNVLGGVGLTTSAAGNTVTVDLDIPVIVPYGGTGNTTFTAYSVITAGVTATSAFQNVSGLGTSGQVLTSNGAATLPTWQTPAAGSGGGWVWLARGTFATSLSVSFTSLISSTYDNYVFVYNNLKATAGADYFSCILSTDNGATYVTSADYVTIVGVLGNMLLTPGSLISTDAGSAGVVWLYRPYISGQPAISSTPMHRSATNTINMTNTGGILRLTNVYDAIRFQMGTGVATLASGTIDMYGISKS